MRFRIDTELFRRAIEITSHATTASNLTPILENILIEAQYKKVVITGNNLEMAIEYIIEEKVDVEVEGKFTISSKFLSSYIALVQESEIQIELDTTGSFIFKTDSSETKFKWVGADKFPVIPLFHSTEPLGIEWRDIRQAIDKTLFSTAEGNIRPMLAGIYLRAMEDVLVFASTDSFRLSEFRVRVSTNHPKVSIIIPTKTALELARIITDDSKDVKLFIHENQLLITSGNIRLSSRLLSGKFPEYEAFFPTEYNTKSVILRNELSNAIKQTNLVARENNYNTRIRSLLEGKIEISTGDTEVGKSHITLSASVEWVADIIWLNAQYLLQALSIMREDYISIEYKSPLSPIVIKWVPAESGKYGYRHLIMPLKI
jgi:DNA polymerase III subunit beta